MVEFYKKSMKELRKVLDDIDSHKSRSEQRDEFLNKRKIKSIFENLKLDDVKPKNHFLINSNFLT